MMLTRTHGAGRGRLVEVLKNNIQVISLCIMAVVFAAREPNFFTFSNAMTLLKQINVLALVAIGGSLVVMTGNMDLAVGSFIGLTGLVLALTFELTHSISVAILAALLTGAAAGLFNGFLIARLRLNSVIITIAALIWGRGLVVGVTRGRPIRADSPLLTYLADGQFLWLAFPLFLIAIFYGAFFLFLHHTRKGYHIFAVGCSEEVATNAGIKVPSIKMLVFLISGITAALGGIISVGRTASALSITGQGLELDMIIAIIIGGNRLSGGRGSAMKVLLGVLFVGFLSNGFSIMAVPGTVVQMLKGLVIILAIVMDRLSYGREEI
jgi:ribose transport system permease protein